MRTAILIKKLNEWRGDARLYKLSIPYIHKGFDSRILKETIKIYNYVVVSAVDLLGLMGEPETLIFGADENGNVDDMAELEGSFKGELNHERALEGLGYKALSSFQQSVYDAANKS